MSDSYNFCLHTGFPNHREIVIPVDIDWEQLCAKICDELSLTGVQYLELCDMNEVIVGERISDIDDFSLSRQYVSTNTMYKVYGTAAQNEEKSDVNISVNKPVASLTSHSFGEVIMTPTYDPLNDLAMMQSVTSAKPKESTSTTPDTTTCHVGTSSDLQAEQLSSATTSTEVHSDQTKSALYSSCADNATLPSASQTSISHSDAPLSEPREQTTSTDFASSLQNILAGLSRIESSIEFPSAEAKSIYLSTSMPEVSAVDISSSSRPNMAGLKTSAELEMERQREEEERKRLQAIEDAKKLRELLDLERKAAQQRLTPAESEGGEVDSGAADEKRKRTEAIARERLAAKEARRQARIHEYEEAHSMDTSQSSLAGREHRSHGGDDDDEDDEKEWARSEEDKARLRAQEVERKKRVGTIASRRRASDGLQGGSSLGHSSSHLSSDRLQAMGGVKLPAMTMHHPVEILFRSSNDPSDVIPITVEDQCDWIELTTVVGVFLGIDDPESISHFILVDEDGDETSGCISDDTKFWKFYSRRYLSGEDMSYVVYHSQSDSSQRMSTHSNIQGTKQQYPKKENYGSSQMNFAKDRNVAKEMRKEALAADAASAWSAKRSNSGQAEPLYFRWSTDYVDERTEVLVPSSCSWEDISILLSKSLASPREHTAGRNLERISLFDDDGDEVAGPIDTIDKFWTIVRGRYSHSSTVFVATLESEGEQKQTSHSYSEDLSKKGSISIKCRLNDRNSELVRVTIPDDGSWDQISLAIVRNFKLSGYCVESISLVDDDGDDVLGCIMNEKKFWKAVHNRYDEDTMYFMISLASSPIVDYKVVFCRLSTQDASTKVEVKIRTDGSWEDIERALLDSFRLSGMCVERIDLIDDDGDDVFGSITNEKKFWKAVKSRYNEEDMTFVIKTIKKAGAADQASVTTKAEPVIPTTPLNFRLSSDNTGGKVVIDVPINGTWDEVGASVVNGLNLPSGSSINHIDLIDDDGDEVFSCIVAEQKFWKAVKSRYVAEEMVFVVDANLKTLSVCAVDINVVSIFFRLHKAATVDKQLVDVPVDGSWEDIERALLDSFRLSGMCVERIDLIDDDGDDVFGSITNEKKFWKAVKSRYNEEDMTFVIKTIKKAGAADQASVTTKAEPVIPTTPLNFRLSSDNTGGKVVIDVPINGTWDEVGASVVNGLNLPSGSSINHIDLIDDDGDEVFSCIVAEQKFWKAVKSRYVAEEMVFVADVAVRYDSGGYPVEIIQQETVPFYFRLSTDNMDDKAVINIPLDSSWEDIVLILVEFFEIDARRTVRHIDLVDDDGDEVFSTIQSHKKFWKAANSRYNNDEMVFVVTVGNSEASHASIPSVPTLTVSCCLSSDMDVISELDIPLNGLWVDICDTIAAYYNLASGDNVKYIQLIDSDGDDVFSKIVDAKKFWKAAKGSYVVGETTFVIHCDFTYSSGYTTVADVPSPSSSFSNGSHTTPLYAPPSNGPSVNTDGIYKAPSIYKKPATSDNSESLSIYKSSTKSTAQASSDSQPHAVLHTYTPPAPGSKYDGVVVAVAFKMSSDFMNSKIVTSVPAMGTWGQINDIIRDTFNLPRESTIDHLELLSDEGEVLLGNIVSASKFWKACLEIYKDDGSTVFNIIQSGASTHDAGGNLASRGMSSQSLNTSSHSGGLGNSGHAKYGSTPPSTITTFLAACGDGDVEAVSDMLQHGADVNMKDDVNLTGIHVACIRGAIKIVQLLVDKEASITCRDIDGNTPLHFACENNHTQIAIYLVRMGADTSLRNRAGLTSLHYICMNGNMKLTLLIRDYMINVATSTGLTLLHCAADMGHSEMVEYLIDHDAQIQPRDDEGLTPLHLAVIGGHIDCAEILIDSGAYWNVRDDQGLSPLLHACKDGNSEMVSFLLDCGCNILARSDSGDSAMHFAGESGSMDLMKLLLERNVDINCRNKNGETPLEIASANGHDHLVGWMEDRGATMRPETQEEATTRMQVDAKTEAASRAFEAEEELNLQRELAEENAQKKK